MRCRVLPGNRSAEPLESIRKHSGANMPELFETTELNGMTLKNRFVRSATNEGLATGDGMVTPRLIACLERLARGGVGLIITGHAYVQRDGQARPRQLGIYGDELLPGLSELTKAIHDRGGKVLAQLAHAGCQACRVPPSGLPCGPSAMKAEGSRECRAMTRKEISSLAIAFGQAADRAKRAGFDGVQVHAAHGYLLSQFLSPFFNKREDEYGGSTRNRARLLLEVCRAVRSAVGERFPLTVKINSEDFVDGGFTRDEMLQVAAWLEEIGTDAIELSGGMVYSGERSHIRKTDPDAGEDEVFYLDAARRYKAAIHVPLILVGGIRSFETAERLVENGITDYIALCRPLIREPSLINRWKSGDTRKSLCLSDNACHKSLVSGDGLRCMAEPTPAQETQGNVVP